MHASIRHVGEIDTLPPYADTRNTYQNNSRALLRCLPTNCAWLDLLESMRCLLQIIVVAPQLFRKYKPIATGDDFLVHQRSEVGFHLLNETWKCAVGAALHKPVNKRNNAWHFYHQTFTYLIRLVNVQIITGGQLCDFESLLKCW